MDMVEERNAIITGSRRGIGKATLELFAQNGINVWACSRSINDDDVPKDTAALFIKISILFLSPIIVFIASFISSGLAKSNIIGFIQTPCFSDNSE